MHETCKAVFIKSEAEFVTLFTFLVDVDGERDKSFGC